MKPRTYLTLLSLLGVTTMMSCTSSLQVSNASSWGDEIYGTSAKPKNQQISQNEGSVTQPEKKVNSSLNNLEQKYADVLEVNIDSIKNDTVIYVAEDTNPYSNILSDSYQESYERRLKGLEDPWYGINNNFYRYSDAYWYAQAYDPYFYNIVVMGGQVWVEPRYISAMFAWPRTSFSFGFGYGWNYSYWNYNPWYYGWNDPWWYSNSYYAGWHDASWHWAQNNAVGDYYYGRRSSGSTFNTSNRRTSSELSRMDNGQATISRRGAGVSGSSATSGSIESTRRTQTRITPTYENGQISSTRREGNTRTQVTSAGTERPTRAIGVSEPTRRTYNSTSGRTRTTSGRESVSSGRTSTNSTTTARRPTTTTTSRGSSTPTYNRPSRVSTPSSTSNSNRNDRVGASDNNSSRNSGSSYSTSRSSSSSSSGSTRSSSNSSSGSSNSRRR